MRSSRRRAVMARRSDAEIPEAETSRMMPMPIVDLLARGRELALRGERVSVLWQEPESLAFVARDREYRSEFHVNPSDEVMLMIKGDMRLHFRTPDGKEEVAVVAEGSTIYTPA